MHKKRDEAIAEAPVILRPLLRSRCLAMSNRHHYLHHTALPANFNLSFTFGDWLYGDAIQPNVRDLLAIDDAGILYHGAIAHGRPR